MRRLLIPLAAALALATAAPASAQDADPVATANAALDEVRAILIPVGQIIDDAEESAIDAICVHVLGFEDPQSCGGG